MNTNRLHRYWLSPKEKEQQEPRAADRRSEITSRNELIERMSDFLGDHPATTLAVATSIGVILGWLIKRR